MNAFEGGNSLEINMSGSVKKPKKKPLVGQDLLLFHVGLFSIKWLS